MQWSDRSNIPTVMLICNVEVLVNSHYYQDFGMCSKNVKNIMVHARVHWTFLFLLPFYNTWSRFFPLFKEI